MKPSPERIEGTKTLVRQGVKLLNEALRLCELDGIETPVFTEHESTHVGRLRIDETRWADKT